PYTPAITQPQTYVAQNYLEPERHLPNPPSVLIICPVIHKASSVNNQVISCAGSSGWPNLPYGNLDSTTFHMSSFKYPVSTGPGFIVLTVILSSASWSEIDMVISASAPLDAA